MSQFLITVTGKGIRQASVDKLLADIKKEYGNKATVTLRAVKPAESRADRFSEAQSFLSDARSEFENLRDELQDWYDNLPENFQQGDKGSQLEEAISNLDSIISDVENCEGQDVEFPGMY